MALRRFSMITEVDARQIEPGTTVVLEAKGHVTPLAADTLRERRVTVSRDGAVDSTLPEDLAPIHPVRRVAIGSDHTGVALKATLVGHLRKSGLAVIDCGTDGPDTVDYPDIAAAVGKSVARGEVDAGIVIDGSGLGSAMAANKIKGVRAAICHDIYSAHQGVEHDDMNILVLGGRIVGEAVARELVSAFVAAQYSGEERHARRLAKVIALDNR